MRSMLSLPQPPNLNLRIPRRAKRAAFTLVTGLCLWMALAIATPFEAGAVLISTGNGSGNTTPPTPDPGFDNVGNRSGLSGVYVRNGWVLTPSHVGEGPIVLLGVSYDPVPGSGVRFQNPDTSFADLMAFKILDAKPPLPDLAITDAAPTAGTLITIIGNGQDRGTPTTWNGIDGWNWGTSSDLRWGTNEIISTNWLVLSTRSFRINFDDLPPGQASQQHEADLVTGDSGGAAFTGGGATAELIGILFARGPPPAQPPSTSLWGNPSYIVDLFAYRNDIIALIDQPDCSDGLDDDNDGLIDYPDDPGCLDALDSDERGANFVCDNGIDDDGDGFTDFPNDDGCDGPRDQTEIPPVPNTSFGAGLLALALYTLARQALRRRSDLV